MREVDAELTEFFEMPIENANWKNAVHNKKLTTDVNILSLIIKEYPEWAEFTFHPWIIDRSEEKKMVTFTRKVSIFFNT